MITSRQQTARYLVMDLVAVVIAFFVFTSMRYDLLKLWVHPEFSSFLAFLTSRMVVLEFALLPAVFILLSWLTGFYDNVMYKSRLQVVGNTLLVAAICTLLFYLLAVTNDVMPRRRFYYEQIAWLLGLLLAIDGAGRWILATAMARRIRRGAWRQNVVVVGASARAAALGRRLMRAKRTMGLDVKAYVDLDEGVPLAPGLEVPVIALSELRRFIDDNDVKALVLAAARPGVDSSLPWVGRLIRHDLPIYISPDTAETSQSMLRDFANVVGEPLIDVARADVPHSTANLKRVSDVAVSLLVLTLLSPLFAAIALAVKLDSRGPVFYRQRRVGYHRRPFRIIKFRSMHTDAEASGSPQLSSPDDDRVTRVGRVLRKYRLDELPNFINVLRGEMALVGPRPERPYYVEKIMEQEPLYAIIHSVRPGITGWGMVKFGYAQTVDEMVERLRYDLIYVRNVSLGVDLKILFYTIRTVVTGRGI